MQGSIRIFGLWTRQQPRTGLTPAPSRAWLTPWGLRDPKSSPIPSFGASGAAQTPSPSRSRRGEPADAEPGSEGVKTPRARRMQILGWALSILFWFGGIKALEAAKPFPKITQPPMVIIELRAPVASGAFPAGPGPGAAAAAGPRDPGVPRGPWGPVQVCHLPGRHHRSPWHHPPPGTCIPCVPSRSSADPFSF